MTSGKPGQAGRRGQGVRREGLPELAAEPILERLDEAPVEAPKSNESAHDKVRRQVIDAADQWVVLNTRTALNEASARRLARSYQRAKPARLVEAATRRFAARPFVRDDRWLVAVTYQPSNSAEPRAAGQVKGSASADAGSVARSWAENSAGGVSGEVLGEGGARCG